MCLASQLPGRGSSEREYQQGFLFTSFHENKYQYFYSKLCSIIISKGPRTSDSIVIDTKQQVFFQTPAYGNEKTGNWYPGSEVTS